MKRLLPQIAHTGVFFVLNYASRILLAIAVGKSLSTGDYGLYSLIASALAVAVGVLPLGVSQYYMREIPGMPPAKAAGIFKSVVGIQTVILAVVTAAFCAFALLAPGRAPEALTVQRGLLPLIAAIVLAESLATDFTRYLFARKQIESANVVSFLQTGCWAAGAFFLYMADPTRLNLTALLAFWAASLSGAVAYGAWKSRWGTIAAAPLRPSEYASALRFGLPLLCANLLIAANAFGRFLLAGTHSVEQVGLFSFHYNIMLMVIAVTIPIVGNPMEPYVIQAYNTGRFEQSGKLLSASLLYRLMIVVPLLAVVVFWNGPLIRLLARDAYQAPAGLPLLLAAIPALTVLNSILERVLFLERKTGAIARCYAAAAAVQFALTWALVPRHPYFGPAAAAIGGLLTLAVCLRRAGRDSKVVVSAGPRSWAGLLRAHAAGGAASR